MGGEMIIGLRIWNYGVDPIRVEYDMEIITVLAAAVLSRTIIGVDG
jgi:hypothetical protein